MQFLILTWMKFEGCSQLYFPFPANVLWILSKSESNHLSFTKSHWPIWSFTVGEPEQLGRWSRSAPSISLRSTWRTCPTSDWWTISGPMLAWNEPRTCQLPGKISNKKKNNVPYWSKYVFLFFQSYLKYCYLDNSTCSKFQSKLFLEQF